MRKVPLSRLLSGRSRIAVEQAIKLGELVRKRTINRTALGKQNFELRGLRRERGEMAFENFHARVIQRALAERGAGKIVAPEADRLFSAHRLVGGRAAERVAFRLEPPALRKGGPEARLQRVNRLRERAALLRFLLRHEIKIIGQPPL